MKVLILLLLVFLFPNEKDNEENKKLIQDTNKSETINDINQSIIDGFFEGDSTVVKNDSIYLLK